MKTKCILVLAALLAVSCNTTPEVKDRTEIWRGNYETFRQSPARANHIYVDSQVVDELKPETTSIHLSRSEQRGQLLHKDEYVAIDFPISTGRSGYTTPAGPFKIISKKDYHRSNLYGDFVDAETGKVVERNVSTRNDTPPEGADFRGASMPHWMRLTNSGVGLHTGEVPGYPASHGCIRVPVNIMPDIYAKAPINTPVTIE